MSYPAAAYTSPLSPAASWPTALDQAQADLDQAEHAYEAARRTGDPLALFVAHNRRAAAAGNHEATRLASLTPQELVQEETDRQGIHHYAIS